MAKSASITRRAALSAAAIFTLPVAAVASIQAPASQDAAIFDLNRQRLALVAERAQLQRACEEAAARYAALKPTVPDDLKPKGIDYAAIPGISLSGLVQYTAYDRPLVEAALEKHYDGMFEVSVRNRCKSILAALDDYEPRLQAAVEMSGVGPAEDAREACDDRLDAVEREILSIRATTPEGMAVKASILTSYYKLADGTFEHDIVRSIVADLGVQV